MTDSDISVLLIDGYIDDPAALGVPPYISPLVRAVAGAAADAGGRVRYITIDMIRNGCPIPDAKVSIVISGNTVPGKYLRTMPMSLRELDAVVPKLKGWKLVGGSAADSKIASKFNFAIKKDIAASLYDGMIGKEVLERYRTLDEWNRWMLLGADVVQQHHDFPQPLIAEVETYRGCCRYKSGGCSYCIEPLKGKPLMRRPQDVLAELTALKNLGIRNIRIGGQTCIISYGSDDDSDTPRPNPDAIRELFEGIENLGFDVVHVDNANPAVISTHPTESEEVLRIISKCCTPGNVLALGMESADIRVVKENNLNSTPDQVTNAIRMINKIGSERGKNGVPRMLPGLNIIAGLDGETDDTYDINLEFLRNIVNEGLMLRRINIRQVMPIRREFNTKINHKKFTSYKNQIREEIDRTMLERILPRGTIVKNVYMEFFDGGVTFGRQIGTYPLLIGVPYKTELEEFRDVIITDWGFRSVTGIEYPFVINRAKLAAIASLPGIGKKRAARIVSARPLNGIEDLTRLIDDETVVNWLQNVINYEK